MGEHVDTAMIMAAGKGTRMMPLTADRPKPLIEVAGVALLDHVLGHLRTAGIGKVVINAHYRAAQVEDHMGTNASDFEVMIIRIEYEIVGSYQGLQFVKTITKDGQSLDVLANLNYFLFKLVLVFPTDLLR